MQGDPRDPYRAAEQRPQTELERLAAEGQRRHAMLASQQSHDANREADDNLRVAIGGHFGTPLLRGFAYSHYMVIACLVTSILLLVTHVVDEALLGPVIGVSALLTFLLIFARVFVPPTAARSQVDSEAAYFASLPFPVTGYFEALGETPSYYCNIEVLVEFASQPPAQQTLAGVVRLTDPSADAVYVRQRDAQWRSGQISGNTNINVNGRAICRNHRVVKWAHDVVTHVLLPMHSDYPITRVTMTRR